MELKSLMNTPGCILFSLAISASQLAAQPQSVPVDQLGENFQLVGKLHVPLGQLTTVAGYITGGNAKRYESHTYLRVQTINGLATQEDIDIRIEPLSADWGQNPRHGGNPIPEPEMGITYEMKGYETGGYYGRPAWTIGQDEFILSNPDHHFQLIFYVTESKQIKPIVFDPGLFEGRSALFQGTAKTIDGKACMMGIGWAVTVIPNASWPEHVEGRMIETYGMYNPEKELADPANPLNSYSLLDGEWRLVKLDDQVGHNVKLRGHAISMNGNWWFNYRNTDVYVENMQDLPGWIDENHFRPMEISGRLEKAKRPRLDQVSLKSSRDLEEYFIVRDATWKPLESLLSPETDLRQSK